MSAYIKRTESSNKQLNATSQMPSKTGTSKTQNKRREIIIRKGSINEIETKKNIQRINETKIWFTKKIRSTSSWHI
jgi:hypothetical protein